MTDTRIEWNCCSNPVTLIQIYRIAHPEYKDTPALKLLLERIEADSLAGIEYLKKLQNPTDVRWSTILQERDNAKASRKD